jgi:hypothetical protein
LAEQVKARRLIPMLVVFGLTKTSQRTPAQSVMALAKNRRPEFLFTEQAVWVMPERWKVLAETSQVAKAKTHDVAVVPETRAAPALVFGTLPEAGVGRKRVKSADGETQPPEFVAAVVRVEADPARWL